MLALACRHAESCHNAGEHAHPDSDLSDLGRRQADALARRLAPLRIAAVYSSPYRRAIQTAQPVAAALHLPVRIRGELSEFYGGTTLDLVGFSLPTPGDLPRRFPGVISDPDDTAADWPPLVESLPDLVIRQQRLVANLRARWTTDDDRIVLIGHGSPIARFIEAWLTDAPGPSFRFVIHNATVNALRCVRGVRSLLCLNEASHLPGPSPDRDRAWLAAPPPVAAPLAW